MSGANDGFLTRKTHFSDPGFLGRFRNRDEAAIAEVVDAYLPHVVNAARAVGLDAAAAVHVVQDTFSVFIEKAHTFEARSSIRTWFFGIFYRKVSEARRRMESGRRYDAIDDVVAHRFAPNGTWSHPPQPIAVCGAEFHRHLEDVPLAQRMAFVLREVEELDSPEICKILEVSRTNLGVLFFRGRNRLRECLESKGVK